MSQTSTSRKATAAFMPPFLEYKPGDWVHLTSNQSLQGVVIDYWRDVNMVIVAWGGVSVKQHSIDEITPEIIPDGQGGAVIANLALNPKKIKRTINNPVDLDFNLGDEKLRPKTEYNPELHGFFAKRFAKRRKAAAIDDDKWEAEIQPVIDAWLVFAGRLINQCASTQKMIREVADEYCEKRVDAAIVLTGNLSNMLQQDPSCGSEAVGAYLKSIGDKVIEFPSLFAEFGQRVVDDFNGDLSAKLALYSKLGK